MCSDVDQRRLKEIAPDSRIEVVPNGVDVDYFRPLTGVEQVPALVFVGTLNWYPNIEAVRFIAFELWPLLKKELSGVTVDIIGANPPKDICDVAVSDPDFHVHGFVDDIRGLIDRAAIYVCPIRDGGGTKLKILDALAMQKAIVAHPIACEGIDVTNGENVVFAEEPLEYVNAIRRLLDDPAERQRLGRNARKCAVDRYSYENIGESLSNLYIETAGIHRSAVN